MHSRHHNNHRAFFLLGCFFFISLFAITHQHRNCTRECDLNDEPAADESSNAGDVWQQFVDLLEANTFHNYSVTVSCNNHTDDDDDVATTTTTLAINQASDFLWDLRFKIYNERQDRTAFTVDMCMCQMTDCSVQFAACMTRVREHMIADLGAFWQAEIAAELERMRQDVLKQCIFE